MTRPNPAPLNQSTDHQHALQAADLGGSLDLETTQ